MNENIRVTLLSTKKKKKIDWQSLLCYNLIMMLLRARDNNIQSFAYIWLHKVPRLTI